MANTVSITFAGDAQSLQQAAQRAERSMADVASSVDEASDTNRRFSRSADDVSDSLGNGAGKLRATNDLVSGFADSVGIALPAQAGMIMGFADMADGMGELLAPALKKGKAAMQGLNTVMRANPMLTVITLVGLLVAGFVIAYKKSETFRKIVDGAFSGIRKAFQWTVDKGEQLWGWFKQLPGKISGAFSGLASIITTPYRLAFNGIASAWNNTVGRLSFHIPGWVPGIGGNGFDVPDIPMLAKGGVVTKPTLAMIGEAGPEAVIPLSRAGGMGAGGEVRVIFDGRGVDREMLALLRKMVRVEGGGDVQRALGRA